MREKWKRCFQNWSTTSEFQKKIEMSRNIIQEKLKQYSRPYVAFSGGKDSLCVLHLVLQENPNITVVHWDYGKYYFPRSLFQEVQDIISQFLVQDFRVYTNHNFLQKFQNHIQLQIGLGLMYGHLLSRIIYPIFHIMMIMERLLAGIKYDYRPSLILNSRSSALQMSKEY